MLTHYYDHAFAAEFDSLFGSLAVHTIESKMPKHNQHLCIIFNLYLAHVCDDIDFFIDNWDWYVHGILQSFLTKYNVELGHPDESQILQELAAGVSLRAVFVR